MTPHTPERCPTCDRDGCPSLALRDRPWTYADDDDPGDVNHALGALLAATEATP